MKNGEEGAFAMVEKDGIMQVGLTKREYFAGLALQGLLAIAPNYREAVELAVKCADELLKQLENE